MNASSLNDLQGAAKAGDPAAMTALGRRLLSGRDAPHSPIEGSQFIVEAANKGNAEAAEIVAVLAGAGACTPQSWPTAFEYLQLAAERGSARAQAQLIFLVSDRSLAKSAGNDGASPAIWGRLRANIDVARLTQAPPARVVSIKPYLATYNDFLSAAECEWLIERARPNLKRAQLYGNQTEAPLTAYVRTNSSAEFDIAETDIIVLLIRARIAAATAMPVNALEQSSVLHYKIGEEFRRHYDFLDPKVPGMAADLTQRGQRIMTLLAYLNEDYNGGETEFPLINMRYKGNAGGALLFRNVELSGVPDRQTLHAGLAPTRGEKWLLSQWVRDRG